MGNLSNQDLERQIADLMREGATVKYDPHFLFVCAGNYVEYQRWLSKHKEIKIPTKFIPARGVAHFGFRDCVYVEVGTFVMDAEMIAYFETHNIKKYESQ